MAPTPIDHGSGADVREPDGFVYDTREWRVGQHYGVHLGGLSLDSPKVVDLTARLRRRLVRAPDTGCLVWTGGVIPSGYGHISFTPRVNDRRSLLVHRLAYVLDTGPIPEGLHIDHLCRVRRCCEATHLEAVTPSVNWARAHQVKPLCRRGLHPLDGFDPVEGRFCTTCRRQQSRSRANRKWTCPLCQIVISYGNSSNHKRNKHAQLA